MAVQLSSEDLSGIARAARVLLSPLEHAHADDWRRAVNREVGSLLGADSVGFLLPVAGAAPMYSEEHAPETLAPFPDLLPPPLSDGTPIWQRAIALGTSTLETAYQDDFPLYERSAYYNEFAKPGGAAQTLAACMALGGETPTGAASVQLWRAEGTGARFTAREIAMLSLLHPAFRAGVEMWMRFGGQGVEVMRTIDLLDQAVIAFDVRGRIAHATQAVERMLAQDPDQAQVRSAMAKLGERLLVSRSSGREAVATRAARYVLHGCTHQATAAGGDPLMLVSLAREAAHRRTPVELRAVFALTNAEAVVARHVAAGHRNAEIAAMLGISEHTVKRHVEHVLAKLGARSRAEVAARLDS